VYTEPPIKSLVAQNGLGTNCSPFHHLSFFFSKDCDSSLISKINIFKLNYFEIGVVGNIGEAT
jgi:hypothetical protein